MSPLFRRLARLLTVYFCAALLAACGGRDPDSAAPATNNSANTQKYNAYIVAFNQYGQAIYRNIGKKQTFAAKHAALTEVLNDTYNFQKYAFNWDTADHDLRVALEKALALPGKQEALDGVAQALLDALKQLHALDHELPYYSESKGSLADGGAKVKALAPQLLPLLEQADHALIAFEHAMEQADDALMRQTMDETKDGTPDKYRITAVYYAKRIYSGLHAAFDDVIERQATPPQAQLLEQLQEDLQAFDRNTQAYLAYIAEKKLEGQCRDYRHDLPDFLAHSRSLLQDLQSKDLGYWQSRARGRPVFWDMWVQRGFEKIIRRYNSKYRQHPDC